MSRIIPLHPNRIPPVIGFVGSSGSGKTTLIEAVIPVLARAGVRCAVLKHAHKRFDMDRPGKDTYRVREAGAAQVLVASRERWVLMGEAAPGLTEPPFQELLRKFDSAAIDLVLVEGFAGETYPKIEVYRPSHGKPSKCWPADPAVIAVATDAMLEVDAPTVRLDLNRPDEVAGFLIGRMAGESASRPARHAV